MKTVALLLLSLAGNLAQAAPPQVEPKGTLLELHSCELYAGGCIVSSEATQGGQYMLRAWDFTGGTFAGVQFQGLKVALLQRSGENLAVAGAKPGDAVVYLPDEISADQRNALLDWVRKAAPGLGSLTARTLPLRFERHDGSWRVSAEGAFSVCATPMQACDTGSCGEALWYKPNFPVSAFTVGVSRSASITEPTLQLKWYDAGKRNVFLARFGQDASPANVYLTSTEWCGPGNRLF